MKTFPLTPDQFNQLRTRLLELGITIPGNEGTIIHSGIELKYFYLPPVLMFGTGTLTLSIQKKPIFVPNSMIWDKVGEWLGS
jgi:hypothetical protein